jgi:1,2-dihydroxy-3-keto-5-methylthiopentene dioxygenase
VQPAAGPEPTACLAASRSVCYRNGIASLRRTREEAPMSLLLQFSDSAPDEIVHRAEAFADIERHLAALGVRFERWEAHAQLTDESTLEEILAAYAPDIERLKREQGYLSVDVVRFKRPPYDPRWPEKAHAARTKFLDEHTHAEDEVRFFVEGSGAFYLRIDGHVTVVLCERGDLISVPAGTRHWFDMGSDPEFCAVRLFGNEGGWIAKFTGDKISASFPSFDSVRHP